MELIYERRKHEISFNILDIGSKLNEIGCDNISKVSIKSKDNPEKRIPLLKLLDYTTEYQGKSVIIQF